MNETLYGQQMSFTEVSRLMIEGISWNSISGSLLGFLQTVSFWAQLACNEEHFTLGKKNIHLGFHSRYFPETPNLALKHNWLQTISVSLQLAYNEGHFYYKDKLPSWQYRCFHSRDFPENFHLAPYAPCLQMLVICDRPVMKGTLCEEHSTFTWVSRLTFEVFSWKSTPSTLHALPSNGLSLVAKSIKRTALYLGNKIHSGQFVGFHSMGFYVGSVVLDQYIRALYVEKEVLSALYLAHHPRNASECQ